MRIQFPGLADGWATDPRIWKSIEIQHRFLLVTWSPTNGCFIIHCPWPVGEHTHTHVSVSCMKSMHKHKQNNVNTNHLPNQLLSFEWSHQLTSYCIWQEERDADRKSRDPHLALGEQCIYHLAKHVCPETPLKPKHFSRFWHNTMYQTWESRVKSHEAYIYIMIYIYISLSLFSQFHKSHFK